MKKRIARLARPQDVTPHSSMLEAIYEKPGAQGLRAAFHAEGKRRLERMKRTGRGAPAEEVFAYLGRRAAGGRVRAPRPRKVA